MIENVYEGAEARDAGVPDQRLISPRLRWKNDRWDITARYSYQTDSGTPWASLPLGARDTVNEFLLDRNGKPAIWDGPDHRGVDTADESILRCRRRAIGRQLFEHQQRWHT